MVRSRTLNWQRELILLGLASMETVWLTAFFWTLIRPASDLNPLPTAVLVLALLLAAMGLSRALAYRQVTPRAHWVIMTAALLLAIAAVLFLNLLPTGLPARTARFTLGFSLALGLILAAWWRGNVLAQLDIASPNVVIVHFWIGLSVFFLTIILGEAMLGETLGSTERDPVSTPVIAPTGGIVGFVPVYFFLSVITLSLARIEEVTQLPESTASRPRLRFWLGFIPGVAALLVASSLLLSLFFTGGGLSSTLGLFPPLLLAVGQVLGWVARAFLTLLGWLLALLVPVLDWFIQVIPLQELKVAVNQVLETIQQFEQLTRQMEKEQASPDLWVRLGKYVPVVLLVLLVLLIGRAVRRQRRKTKHLTPEEPDRVSSVWAEPGRGNLLEQGLDRLAGRMREGLRFFHALSIRRIYANLSRLARHEGYPRPVYQTPNEYLELLDEAFPDHSEDVRLITQAYLSAHYGQVPDTDEELERIRKAWQRIRSAR